MNILYIGAGFVGTCSGAASAAMGHTVMLHDIDQHRVNALSSGDASTIDACLYEKGLADLLVTHQKQITFTTDYTAVASFLDICDVVFLCVPTPELSETGETDLSYYNAAATSLGDALTKRNGGKQSKYVVVVNKSTVPIDMVDKTDEILQKAGVKQYGVASNPEFLVEGKAIEGSLHPDRVVVGAWNEKDFSILRELYRAFYDAADVGYIEVNPKEAAAGKLLANFYLFNKLAVCFDVIGRTAEAFENIGFESLRKIISSDRRIGSWGFYDSLYAGGSCFIKDARSLSYQLGETGNSAAIVNEVHDANERQLSRFIERATEEAGFEWKDKTIALLGTAFKRDTNDTRNSPSYSIVSYALEQGVRGVNIYDPMATAMFQKTYPASDQIQYVSHEYKAMKDADVIIIATDWPQFHGLGDILLTAVKDKKPLIMDGRRMLQHRYGDLQRVGFDIIAVGSQFMSGNRSD